MSHPLPTAEPYCSIDTWIAISTHQFLRNAVPKFPSVGSVIFVELGPSHDVKLLKRILDDRERPCVIISTGNFDTLTPEVIGDELDMLITSHPMLTAFFANNVIHPSERCIGLPLGPKWQFSTTDLFGEDKMPHIECLRRWSSSPEESQVLFEKTRDDVLLLTRMAPTHEVRSETTLKALQSAVRCRYVDLPRDKFLEELCRVKFVFSPPGGGPDCHRHWEALLMGAIPIVMRDATSPMFDELPVLLVDSYSDVTETLLSETYERFRSRSKMWDWQRIFSAFWKSRILRLDRLVDRPIPRAAPSTDSLTFIVVRCAKTTQHAEFCKNALRSISRFHPDSSVIVCDDSSEIPLTDPTLYTEVVPNPHPRSGEFGALVVAAAQPTSSVVIMHDTAVLRRSFTETELSQSFAPLFHTPQKAWTWEKCGCDVLVDALMIRLREKEQHSLADAWKRALPHQSVVFGTMIVSKTTVLRDILYSTRFSSIGSLVTKRLDRMRVGRMLTVAAIVAGAVPPEPVVGICGDIFDQRPGGDGAWEPMPDIIVYADDKSVVHSAPAVFKHWAGR